MGNTDLMFVVKCSVWSSSSWDLVRWFSSTADHI